MNILVLPKMTPTEAQGWRAAIGNTANELRILLFDGYEREAWRALGYDNWTDCLQSLAEDFGFTERRLWQLHAANQTEQRLLNRGSVGSIPERQLRPFRAAQDRRTIRRATRSVRQCPNLQPNAACLLAAKRRHSL